MPKYRYRPITAVIEEQYTSNTGNDIYEALGSKVDFQNARLLVTADTPEESEKIRMGFSDVRMWKLEHTED